MNTSLLGTINKVKSKLWLKLVTLTKDQKFYFYLYKSYWYYLFHNKLKQTGDKQAYLTAQPNIGAGIGHQMANWIAGLWFSKLFNLQFVHIPFSNDSWESFLGFGEGEETLSKLLKKREYKLRKLPLFDETKKVQVEKIQNIVNAYRSRKYILLLEQDQFYYDQIGVITELQEKFHSANARQNDKLLFEKESYNVAIHVRRGDIVTWKKQRGKGGVDRWQSNDYFVNVLKNTLTCLRNKKKVKVYFFSQGKVSDFPEFKQFHNLEFCLEMGAQDSFLHMVYADVLITSKSSFSYKPALLNRGLKIVPPDFWHGYPKTKDWVIASEEGKVNIN